MAIELKQSLKLSQQLVITPQLQQAIKLLQLSRIELSEMIDNELLENPVLEEADSDDDSDMPKEVAQEIESIPNADKSHENQAEVGTQDGELKEPKEFDWENYMDNYNTPGEDFRMSKLSDEDLPSFEATLSKTETLQDHLEWQLNMMSVLDREYELVSDMIASLDDDGYLRLSLEDFALKFNCSFDEAEDTLELLHEFDPAGVGARDLQECLLLQVKRFSKDKKALTNLIKEHLPLLEKKDYKTLAKKMKLPLGKVIDLAKVVMALEPKPGRPYGKSDTQYITPDVYVYKSDDGYDIVLNEEGLPKLKVSSFYRNMFQGRSSKDSDASQVENNEKKSDKKGEAQDYVQEKLKGALWLIKSIHQRQRTLYKVSQCIVKFQKEFFDKGIDALKPMILRDVAEEIGMHESTVSRATSNKYMHTPQGIFELKYFFNNAVSSSSGDGVAAETVKDKIKGIVAKEDPKKPYSDKDIVKILQEINIDIARRTVAKYREVLGILPSSKRKQYFTN